MRRPDRREGAARPAAGTGASTQVAKGLSGWAAANHMSHASTNTGPKLTTTGGFIGALFQLIAVPTAANRILTSFWDGVGEGYAFFGSRAGAATPRFITRGAGSTNVDWTSGYVAGDVGKIFFESCNIDADSDLDAYRRGVSAAAQSAGSGAVAPGASSRFRIGDNAEAPNHIVLIGMAYGVGTPLSAAQHLAWFDLIRGAGNMVAAPAGTTDLFVAEDAGATWTSRGSAATVLTRTGTLTLVDVPMVFA